MTIQNKMNTQSPVLKGHPALFRKSSKSGLKGSLVAMMTLTACGFGQANEAIALLIKEKEVQRAWITSANEKLIVFKKSSRAQDITKASISGFSAIYFVEPDEFRDAMSLYNGRDYKAAKEAFAVAKDAYKIVNRVSGNYSTLAAYYEMECCRKLMDFDGIEALRGKFIEDPLVRPSHKLQVELYTTFWEGVKKKEWSRILALFDKAADKKFTVDQRAQVAYCAGLAYEGTNQPLKALNQFNEALISDFGASEVVAQEALKGCLRVINAHPDAQLAIKLHGTENERPNSSGAGLLAEGGVLVELWNKSFGLGKPIPKEYAGLLKYKPDDKPEPKAKPEPKPKKKKKKGKK